MGGKKYHIYAPIKDFCEKEKDQFFTLVEEYSNTIQEKQLLIGDFNKRVVRE